MAPTSSPVSEQPAFTYAIGDVIAGKYELEELLGEGGMGAVFRARNTAIDMPVALKLIRADLDRELLSGRLLQEARAAAKLSHPAIVRVFDVGKTALGDPFIVMELLHGESLAQIIDREGRLSSVRAAQLLLPIADALSVAHAKGFVHRDVKPDNVFIANGEEGQLQPKLVDFGIVKQDRQHGDSQLTQVGAVLGSPDYMSPEQARGLDSIDQRSDVWSFSIVLYETITGTTPFQSSNYNALLRMIVEDAPVSLLERAAADEELSSLVARGLSKDPADRFATMGQLGRALALWLTEHGISEDACGVSLEARWLSRTTDPTSPGRVSRSSSPDSWPEPLSGVRAVSSSRLGNAPTIPLAKHAGTPYSLTSTRSESTISRQLLYWGGAALVALTALLLGWFAALHARGSGEAPASSSAAESAAAARPEPLSEPAPAALLAPAVPSAAPAPPAPEAPPGATAAPTNAPTAKRIGPRAPPVGKAPAKKAAAAEPAKAEKPAPPKSDLLSPY